MKAPWGDYKLGSNHRFDIVRRKFVPKILGCGEWITHSFCLNKKANLLPLLDLERWKLDILIEIPKSIC
jgi:hypothetical protein